MRQFIFERGKGAWQVNGRFYDPTIAVEQLMEFVKGPDFPTGAIIVGRSGIRDAYRSRSDRLAAADREVDVAQRLDRPGRGRVRHPDPVEADEVAHARGQRADLGSSTLVRNSFV